MLGESLKHQRFKLRTWLSEGFGFHTLPISHGREAGCEHTQVDTHFCNN